jgi:hypothetical protein
LRGFIKRCASRIRSYLAEPTLDVVCRIPRPPDAATQIQLQLAYRRLIDDGRPLPRIADIGFKSYSQTDEDGILLFLYSVLGVSKKLCAEICAGAGPAV